MKVLLDRWQFGVTITYHFLFVSLTIGLAFLVAIMQVLAYRRRDEVWERLTRFFGTLFLINFAMGVVTGIVQEFQFGMNWSNYWVFVGNIFGAPLAMEGLLAFFAESTFIALWMFGRNRLPRWRTCCPSAWSASARSCPRSLSSPPTPGCSIRSARLCYVIGYADPGQNPAGVRSSSRVRGRGLGRAVIVRSAHRCGWASAITTRVPRCARHRARWGATLGATRTDAFPVLRTHMNSRQGHARDYGLV